MSKGSGKIDRLITGDRFIWHHGVQPKFNIYGYNKMHP